MGPCDLDCQEPERTPDLVDMLDPLGLSLSSLQQNAQATRGPWREGTSNTPVTGGQFRLVRFDSLPAWPVALWRHSPHVTVLFRVNHTV